MHGAASGVLATPPAGTLSYASTCRVDQPATREGAANRGSRRARGSREILPKKLAGLCRDRLGASPEVGGASRGQPRSLRGLRCARLSAVAPPRGTSRRRDARNQTLQAPREGKLRLTADWNSWRRRTAVRIERTRDAWSAERSATANGTPRPPPPPPPLAMWRSISTPPARPRRKRQRFSQSAA